MKVRWQDKFPHLVAWGAALTAVLVVLLVTQQVVQSERQDTEYAARRELSNLSRLSQEHASRTLHAADQALKLIRALYLRDGLALDLVTLARQGAVDTDIFYQVGIIDAQGIYRLSNLLNTPQVNLADREHFKVHVDRATDELYISKPVIGRVSGKSTIQLTRRITLPDGRFAGVAVVSVDANYFSSFYSSLDMGSNGAVALMGFDGIVRARRDDASASADNAPMYSLPALSLQGQAQGFFEATSSADPTLRLHHFRQIPAYPLYVTVAFGVQDYREKTEAIARQDWLKAALTIALLLGFTSIFSWYQVREQRQRRALEVSHEQMNLALDGGGLGLWEWDLVNGTMQADKRLKAILGFAPEELTTNNLSFMTHLHPDDVSALRQRLPPVLKGEVPRLILEHRVRHKDGHWVWLMARGKVVERDAQGRAVRLVGTDVDRSEQRRLEEATRQSQVLLQNMTDQVPAELFQFKVDPDGRRSFPYASKHFLDFYGVTLAQVQSDASLLFAWHHPEDAAMIQRSVLEAVTQLKPWQLEYRLKLSDGQVIWRSGHATPQKLADGSVVCYGAIFDITERKQAEEALRVSAVAFESSSAMIVSNAEQVILQVNQAIVDLAGYAPDEMIGQPSSLLRSGRHDASFYESMWESINRTGHWQGEIWNRHKGGEVFLDWLSITVVKDAKGMVTHYVSVHADITLRKRTEEGIHKLAFFDPLTDLPNRRLMIDRLQQMCAARDRNSQLAAVLFIDLDRFKLLNDTYGHDQGDVLLIQVAQRLQACVREVDTVARLGGDEFVVALTQLGEAAAPAQASALLVSQKILKTLSNPFVLPAVNWTLSGSIGVAMVSEAKAVPEEVLKQADSAMYAAKAAGRNAVRIWGVVA